MTPRDTIQPGLADLEAVLDAYGSNPRRWPEPLRSPLLRLISQDATANRLMQETVALDEVLSAAPEIAPAKRSALADRIVAAAAAQPRIAATSDQPNSAASAPPVTQRPVSQRPSLGQTRRSVPSLTRDGMAGVAMAASLLLGVMIGQSQSIAPTTDALLVNAGISVDDTSQQFALFDDGDGLSEEDLL